MNFNKFYLYLFFIFLSYNLVRTTLLYYTYTILFLKANSSISSKSSSLHCSIHKSKAFLANGKIMKTSRTAYMVQCLEKRLIINFLWKCVRIQKIIWFFGSHLLHMFRGGLLTQIRQSLSSAT